MIDLNTFVGRLDLKSGSFSFRCPECQENFMAKLKNMHHLLGAFFYVNCTHCGFRMSASKIEFKGLKLIATHCKKEVIEK